jgi:hypothetical protein
MPNLTQYVNSAEDYGRLKTCGKRIRENLQSSPQAIGQIPHPGSPSPKKVL